jgi:hypothetical protein
VLGSVVVLLGVRCWVGRCAGAVVLGVGVGSGCRAVVVKKGLGMVR